MRSPPLLSFLTFSCIIPPCSRHYEYDSFWAYHYPGFDSNSVGGERDVISLMERHAYGIQVRYTITLYTYSQDIY